MNEKQFHQGLRLKNKIEKSRIKIKVISEKSGIALSSIYDLYKKPELLKSRITPILEVLEIEADEFYGIKKPNANEDLVTKLNAEIERLKREIEFFKQQIADKDEIISLLKSTK